MHEQKDHALRTSRKVWFLDRQRIRAGNRSRPQLLFAQQPGKRDEDPKPALLTRSNSRLEKRAVEIRVPVTVHTFL